MEGIKERWGKLDILVNNAGTAGPKTLIRDTSFEEWRRCLATNLDGPFLCSKLAAIHMEEKKQESREPRESREY